MAGTRQTGGLRRTGFMGIFAALVAVAAIAVMPASASAASCPVVPGNATAWVGGSGSLHDDANWTNGTPSGSCDVSITAAGNYTVTMTGGANTKSFVLGGPGSTPHLIISDESPNTNLDAQPAGITIAAGASVTLTCQVGGCPGGGPDINSGPSPFSNAGTITVGTNTGGGAVIGGQITNTGTIEFEKSGSLSGKVTNQSLISIESGATATNSGSSCGDTGASVKNDTGGTIAADGTGFLSVVNYEQGDGVVGGSSPAPINIPCGTLKYSGNGASRVQATGGFNLSGAEMGSNQSLVVLAQSNNTNVTLQGTFTNNGSITLSCLPPGGPPPPVTGCNGGDGGGAGFNVNDKDFVNAGSFTVAAASGTGAGVGANSEGSIINTGTMRFDQSAGLGGPVTNQGFLNIADGKTATSSGSSCGDTGSSVKNDTGGSINGAGTGTLSVLNYEQGAGTTSGSAPVQIPCGTLKYTGTGASTVQVNGGGTPMTGSLAAGQTLRIAGSVNTPPLASAGTIVLGPSATLNTGTLTNTGRLTGTGTVSGSVDNQGAVAPGDGAGTLTVGGSYTQGAGGSLEIEIAGTGAGQFDKLAVSGNANLGGTLALLPIDGYADAAAIGDSVSFLTYGGNRANPFGATTVNPSLPCAKQLTASYDDPGKGVNAVVTSASCGSSGGGGGGGGGSTPPPPPSSPPDTKLGSKPKAVVKTSKAKVQVRFSFTSTVAGATFQCKLDRGAFAACKSPKSYKVKPGKHRFQVRAVGPGGMDASPATFSFKVKKRK